MVRRKVHGLAMAQRTVAVTPERGRLLLVLERREVVEIVGKRVPRRIHGVWRAVTDDAAHHEHIVAASAEESGQPSLLGVHLLKADAVSRLGFSEKLWQLVQSGSCTQGSRPLILSKGTSRAVMPDMSLAACGSPASCSALSSARE